MAPLRSPSASSAARLHVVVDGQLQVLAGNGVLGPRIADFAAVAVHDHVAGAVLPAQQLVVSLLDAGLAHHVAWLIGGIARIWFRSSSLTSPT